MNYRTFSLSALAIVLGFASSAASANNMVSLAIAPTTGVVPRWAIGPNLAGFHFMSQDTGFSVGANRFYSIKNTSIPLGGDITAFTYYVAASGAATNHDDVGSKLTPNSYSALTSADPDVGYGAINFYFIHHKGTTDYFTEIVPGSAVASAVTDLKPMSGPGGPATVTGVSGYFGLTFAAANLGYGLNQFYYLRTDPAKGEPAEWWTDLGSDNATVGYAAVWRLAPFLPPPPTNLTWESGATTHWLSSGATWVSALIKCITCGWIPSRVSPSWGRSIR